MGRGAYLDAAHVVAPQRFQIFAAGVVRVKGFQDLTGFVPSPSLPNQNCAAA